MKRRIAALLCALMLAGSLMGCQDETQQNPDSQTAADTQSADSQPTRGQAYQNGLWYRYQNDMASSPQLWSNARAAGDVMVVTRNQINNSTTDELNALIALQKEHNLAIAVELKGIVASLATKANHNGTNTISAVSFNDPTSGEYAMLKKAIDNGLTIDYFIFDNTIALGIYPNSGYPSPAKRYMSPAEAASETVSAMKFWLEKFPQAQMIYQADLYQYGWNDTAAYQTDNNSTYGDGDLCYQLTMLAETARAQNVPLTSVLIHQPYDYLIGQYADAKTANSALTTDWTAVLTDIASFCDQQKLAFGLTLSSHKSGRSEAGSAPKFIAASIRLLNRAAEAGITPAYCLLDRGQTYPNKTIPETEEYTYTYDLVLLAGQIKNGTPIDLKTISTKAPVNVPDKVTPQITWTFDGSTDGWDANNGISQFTSIDGALNLTSISGDPYFSVGLNAPIRTREAEYFYIRYYNKSISSDSMQLFFSIDGCGYNEPMSVRFVMDEPSEDESWSEIYVNLRENGLYSGNLTSIRLDPGNTAGDIIIDEIALFNKN
ncbi:MAG: hypothetical protein IJC15_03505 [Clostridia bacterium]|nr:hypothetical protein [Clostridia bacterium]